MQEARTQWEYPVTLQRGVVRGSITVWCLQRLGIALGLLPPVHAESFVLYPRPRWICLGFVSNRVSGLLHHRHTQRCGREEGGL